MQTKKIINDGNKAVDEMLDGILAAHPRHLRGVEGSPRSIIARDGPRPGKVGLVIGGGSGHEPTFLGFVGKGLADAAAIGNVFASPPPDPILECAKAVSGGAGVLFMYGNYAGDVMNFDMAAEMAGMDDIEVRTVLTTDDVASAPCALARHAPRRRRQFLHLQGGGCGLRPDALLRRMRAHREEGQRPHLHHGRRAFALLAAADAAAELRDRRRRDGDRHGHPWRARRRPRQARRRPTRSPTRCWTASSRRCRTSRRDRVAILVNSLGSTPLMELYIMNRRVKQRLDDLGVEVHATWVGNYCTSLEMAGASVTLMHLDGELTDMLDHPCDCAMFRAG